MEDIKQENDVKKRVIEEKEALEEKLFKLERFIGGDDLVSLPTEQLNLLEIQLHAMWAYHDILVLRIKIWED